MKNNSGTHYVVVTGGVISGNGKGITAASLGAGLKARGLRVNIQKFDMYLNVDAGTLKPGKHGEVFVTVDGAEADLDLGHYERFLDVEVTQKSSVMQGRILKEMIEKERSGNFRGDDVQVIPHVTNAIQDKMVGCGKGYDVHIIELGGTVGDYEGVAFVEAARQLSHRVGRANVSYVHVVYLPYLEVSGEIKTKPAQNSVRALRNIGILPDFLVARCEHPAPASTRFKLNMFTDVPEESIAILLNAKTVYEVPLTLEEQGITAKLAERIGVTARPDLSTWRSLVKTAYKQYPKTVKVGMVAKYLDNLDTYMSVTEGLKAAAWANKVNLDITWLNAEKLEKLDPGSLSLELMKYDGLLIPGGFGERGVSGMIAAANHAIDHNQPYFGICLGMQVATIAFARKHGFPEAHTKEINPDSPDLVITTMDGQEGMEMTGGTMRLGNYTCKIIKGTLAEELYGAKEIKERHRHRYEFNPKYRKDLEAAGLVVSGIDKKSGLVEIIELPKHRFFIAGQFHPEFTSKPYRAQPLFSGFIKACKRTAR